MSTALRLQVSSRFSPLEMWRRRVPVLARRYRQNLPCPHLLFENFLEPEVALTMAKEFPQPTGDAWTQYRHVNENKLGLPKRELFPPMLGAVTDELNSPEFVEWLSALTGIPKLLADPSLDGGGLHQSERGGYLNVHTDFSTHHANISWYRRVNLILYLNPGWDERWGGAIELWEKSMEGKMTRCRAKYSPYLNNALIFTTDERSLHGFPDPLTCPAGESRKSLALYYYTLERPEQCATRSTDYYARPQDGRPKAVMIWLDKKAIDLYSRAKAHLGFSDELASKVLGFLWEKKKRS
jgi:Rps23 Pro-64 3,4-dihydroxylase Tpa1-like proline 4-hydroxylase